LNSYFGIYFWYSSYNIFRNNIILNNIFNFGVLGHADEHFKQDIDISNTINNKPIRFFIEKSNITIDGNIMDIGYLGLVLCKNITIKNVNISDNLYGIFLWKTSDIEILNCTILRNAWGIGLMKWCSNIYVSNCIISNNDLGITSDMYSSHNNISNCTITNNEFGINLRYSSNFYITNCIVSNNTYGYQIIYKSSNNKIINCIISENNNGLIIDDDSKNNQIHHNHIINNSQQVLDHGTNYWDDGSEGNYWSDYNGLDNGAYGRIAGDGIGDTNIPFWELDNYPLLEQSQSIPIIENNSENANSNNNHQDFSQKLFFTSIMGFTLVIILVSTIFIITTEVGKYAFFSIMAPLYTKQRKKKKDKNYGYIKGSIRGYIIGNPGDNYNSIKRELNLPNGTLTYYLKILEKEGIIRAERDRFNKRFYPAIGKITKDIIELTQLQKDIVKTIEKSLGISQTEIQSKLEISQQRLNYHIQLMVKARLIMINREGKKTECFLIEEAS
jgi:parallel beta-helix repeat protein